MSDKTHPVEFIGEDSPPRGDGVQRTRTKYAAIHKALHEAEYGQWTKWKLSDTIPIKNITVSVMLYARVRGYNTSYRTSLEPDPRSGKPTRFVYFRKIPLEDDDG